jgi:hypothetical protein
MYMWRPIPVNDNIGDKKIFAPAEASALVEISMLHIHMTLIRVNCTRNSELQRREVSEIND